MHGVDRGVAGLATKTCFPGPMAEWLRRGLKFRRIGGKPPKFRIFDHENKPPAPERDRAKMTKRVLSNFEQSVFTNGQRPGRHQRRRVYMNPY